MDFTSNHRPDDMARINTPELAQAFIDEAVAYTREQVGDGKVLLALSGGVDSSVVAALLIKALGKQLVCVHVNHGLMRKGESEQVIEVFRNQMGAELIYVDATDRFLDLLAGVADPEAKRHIIGEEFIKVFDEEAAKLEGIGFLGQGTIYPDILESEAGVKAHHNVGGLPAELNWELVEPVKLLFKDEVRVVGKQLGLPDSMVYRQPFPGPGLGVRCTGAITRDRLAALREADAIVREEIDAAGLDIWQYFCVVPDYRATGVRDGKRAFEWPCIIRCINTVDVMTAEVPELDWTLLKKMTKRILDEVPGICRVAYELSPKPIATVEWESPRTFARGAAVPCVQAQLLVIEEGARGTPVAALAPCLTAVLGDPVVVATALGAAAAVAPGSPAEEAAGDLLEIAFGELDALCLGESKHLFRALAGARLGLLLIRQVLVLHSRSLLCSNNYRTRYVRLRICQPAGSQMRKN